MNQLTTPRRCRNSILLLGVLMGLMSLPLEWLTDEYSIKFGDAEPALPHFRFTGLNTFFKLFDYDIPAWVMVVLGICAGAAQVLGDSKHFYVPNLLVLLLAAVLPLWLAISLAFELQKDASLGIGAVLAQGCLTTPLLAIICEIATQRRREAEEE